MKQNTREWHKARTGRLTASRVGAALGVNPWQTPDDLIRAMVREAHGAEPEFTGSVATRYGQQHEPLAKLDYMAETGYTVEDAGFYVHPEFDWLGASPDGFIGADGMIEIKCPYSLRDKAEPEFKRLWSQPHYYAQVQAQLAVTGRTWCDFYQWGPHGTKTERVTPDSAWWNDNLPKLRAFYERYLAELDNPAHLADRTRVINGNLYEKMLARYDELRRMQDEAKAEQQDIMDALVEAAGGMSAEICGRRLMRVDRKGTVSYAKVVAEKLPGLDLSPWTGEGSVSWRLR